MKIAVTGSSGKLGRAAVSALKDAGHRVTCFDLVSDLDHRTVRMDCSNFGQVMGAFSGVDPFGSRPDAILHLAGVPEPGPAPDHEVFRTNTLGTYNVFSAASRLGIGRVVWASSETDLGLPFADPPAFAPIDETHPDRANWSYALSKQLGEQMADQMVRWSEAPATVSLRFSNVYSGSDYAALQTLQADPRIRRWNLWSYIDVKDAADACVQALVASTSGHERMIIAAPDTLMDRDSRALMAEFFPSVQLRDMQPRGSLLSSAKAQRLIGFNPHRSWRDAR